MSLNGQIQNKIYQREVFEPARLSNPNKPLFLLKPLDTKPPLGRLHCHNRVGQTFALVACVAWRFWLGALSNKGGRGQRNREEIGAEAT